MFHVLIYQSNTLNLNNKHLWGFLPRNEYANSEALFSLLGCEYAEDKRGK